METFTANYQNLNLYFCQSHSPPHPLGWRMRILFGVPLIYSTFLCDKENPFPTKLKLPFHPNKYYTPGTHQNKSKLIFKYPLEKNNQKHEKKSWSLCVLLRSLALEMDSCLGNISSFFMMEYLLGA